MSEYANNSLKAHNQYRAKHGCPPLKLNKEICAYAQQWADDLAKRDAMEHRPNPKYGENIYLAGGMTVNAEMPVKAWYSEIAQYDFAAAKFSPNIGHFTQLVWKQSQEVGIGIAKKGDKTWVVANYNPPGNVVGQFKENVPKAK